MRSYTIQERTFAICTYFETKSFKKVQANFRHQFDCRRYPNKSLIFKWVQKFKEKGTAQNLNSKTKEGSHSGRRKSARSPRKIDAVRNSVSRSPTKSLRRRSQELGISCESVWRNLVSDLHLYPYRIQIKHKLTQEDMQKRVRMCQWFCDQIDENPDFLNEVWFSDEAHFLLSGHVNSKNNIFWGEAPPDHCLQRPLHSTKCTAWVAISKHGLIGPYWFEDDNQQSVMVNSERYLEVLRKFWTALGRRQGIDKNVQWFQQDGATPHTSNVSLEWLQRRFGERLISRRCPVEWAPHSPDLNPPDFYLWGYLKDNVYQNNPRTIPELKTAITAKIRAIPVAECIRVIDNFARRVQVCLQRGGSHLEHVLQRA